MVGGQQGSRHSSSSVPTCHPSTQPGSRAYTTTTHFLGATQVQRLGGGRRVGKAAGHLSPRCGCPGRLAGQPDPVTDRDQRGDNCVTPLRLAKQKTTDRRNTFNSKDLKKREQTIGPRQLTCAGSPWHQTLTSNSTCSPRRAQF